MELNTIKQTGTWGNTANSINDNFDKINVSIERLEKATSKNKGYFKTVDKLRDAYPTAPVGSIAYVGSSYPFVIWVWNDETKEWKDSGEIGGDEGVDLDDYYTKSVVDDKVDAVRNLVDNVMSETEYEALEVKEDKFYFTFEE